MGKGMGLDCSVHSVDIPGELAVIAGESEEAHAAIRREILGDAPGVEAPGVVLGEAPEGVVLGDTGLPTLGVCCDVPSEVDGDRTLNAKSMPRLSSANSLCPRSR